MFLREGTGTPLSSSRLGSLIPEPAGSAQNHTWADRSLRCQVLLPPPAGEARGAPSGRHRPCRSQAPGGDRAASLRRISAEPRSGHQAAAAVGCGSSAPDPSAQARGRCAVSCAFRCNVCCLLKSCGGLLTSRVHTGPGVPRPAERAQGAAAGSASGAQSPVQIGSPCFLKCPNTHNTPTYTHMHTLHTLTHSHTHAPSHTLSPVCTGARARSSPEPRRRGHA